MRRGEKRDKFGQCLKASQKSLTGFTHIKEVIHAIFTAPAFPIGFDDMRIWKLWDSVVGKTIAEHAQPSTIKKGVLVVKVSDSVWLQELEFKAKEIKERLNGKLQSEPIKKIRFKIGEPTRRRSENVILRP